MTLPSYDPAPRGAHATPKKRSPLPIVSTVLLVLVAATALFVVFNRQLVVDAWTAWTYTPNAAVQGYIDRATMTDRGAFLLEASTPTIASAQQFNTVCTNLEAGSGVLGCYENGTKTITLFDIVDERLDGMEEVVASHEMLHAAWDRMSDDDRASVGALLEAEAAALQNDPDFAARMELYARSEPGQRLNELHSIIGTEVPVISAALEAHYAEYFTDRAALVALHEKSIVVFNELEAATAALIAEMDALQAGIKADFARYNAGYTQLNADINDFNRRVEANELSEEEYNSERAALLRRQADLDALFATIESRNATWHEKQAQLEQLNAQAAALNTSINVVPRTAEQ